MKKLFGGFSGSLSLFTNNPYQTGNIVDVAGASALLPNEKGDCKEPLKKAKKLTGKEESKKAPTEPILHPAKEKKKKKKNEINNLPLDLKSKSQDVAEKSIAITDGASVDIEEGVQSVKKNKDKKFLVADDIGVSNAVLTQSIKELSIMNKEKEKQSKCKVVKEKIQEEFEKKFRGSNGKKAKSEVYVQGIHSEDPEIDNILNYHCDSNFSERIITLLIKLVGQSNGKKSLQVN